MDDIKLKYAFPLHNKNQIELNDLNIFQIYEKLLIFFFFVFYVTNHNYLECWIYSLYFMHKITYKFIKIKYLFDTVNNNLKYIISVTLEFCIFRFCKLHHIVVEYLKLKWTLKLIETVKFALNRNIVWNLDITIKSLSPFWYGGSPTNLLYSWRITTDSISRRMVRLFRVTLIHRG